MWLVGIDEAGRGPVIGPLVITIFACKENKVEGLQKQGVKDSKLLSSKKRIELSKMLSENDSFYSQTAVISAHEIDNFVDSTSLNDLEITYFAKLILSHCQVAGFRYKSLGSAISHWIPLSSRWIPHGPGARIV